MRMLVTGGAGFIGSTLVDRLLAEEHSVDVIDDLSHGSLTNLADARRDHPGRLTFHRLDVRSTAVVELLRRREPEVVFHLAARGGALAARGGALAARGGAGGPDGSPGDPVDDADVDVLGALRVIDAARQSGAAKVVFASSAAVYGDVAASDLPVRESHAQRPTTLHGAAKKAVADYLWAYRETYNLEFTALVLPDVYGPRQAADPGAAPSGPVGPSGPVVATFAARLLAGQACTLDGGGRQTRDFVYVDDVVDAFARAAKRGGGLSLNVGTGTETSVAAVYQAVAAAVGVEREPLAGPTRPGEPARLSLDPGRAGIHLGWKPWTKVAEGVAGVVEALRP